LRGDFRRLQWEPEVNLASAGQPGQRRRRARVVPHGRGSVAAKGGGGAGAVGAGPRGAEVSAASVAPACGRGGATIEASQNCVARPTGRGFATGDGGGVVHQPHGHHSHAVGPEYVAMRWQEGFTPPAHKRHVGGRAVRGGAVFERAGVRRCDHRVRWRSAVTSPCTSLKH